MLKDGYRLDLILLDVMMPKLDGRETYRLVKENEDTNDIKVVMLTVRAREDDKIKSLDYARSDWHISKPINRESYIKTVKWILESP